VSAKKSLGETVLGWFVVREGEDDANVTPEELIEKYGKKEPAPPAAEPAPPPVQLQGEVPRVPAGAVPDARVYPEVYRAANISNEEQERVEKVLALLQSLPTETAKDVRRQIVEASLKAFGIPIDQIIETSAQEIQALEAYIVHGERHTQSVLQDATAQIDKLSARIGEIKKLMEMQVKTQQAVEHSANEQKLRVQAVLEFFGQEAVARVVKSSPKLIEPR
jgi:hypothetical protein